MKLRNAFIAKDIVRLYTIILSSCIFIHFCYVCIFYVANIDFFTIFNVFSTMIYAFVTFFFALHKTRYVTIVSVVYFEILLHATLATLMLGWQNGFYLQVICMIPIAFYCPLRYKYSAYIFSGISIVTFFFLRFYTYNYPALMGGNLHEPSTRFLYLFNCVTSIMPLILFASNYYNSTRNSQFKLSEKNKNLQKLADTDPLTGMRNRRSMIAKLEQAMELKEISNIDFSLIIFDIDDFKLVNDQYGHDCGDYVLKTLSGLLTDYGKSGAYICRWGGEEILIMIPTSDVIQAKYVAEEIRHAVETYPFSYGPYSFHITITLGISSSEKHTTINDMLLQADKNLYCGKQNGKNCAVCHCK